AEAEADVAGEDVKEPEPKRARTDAEILGFEALRRVGYGAEAEAEEAARAKASLEGSFCALQQKAKEEAASRFKVEVVEQKEEEDSHQMGCEEPPESIEVYDEQAAQRGEDAENQWPPWSTLEAAEEGLTKPLVDAMRAVGFTEPTPIQAQAWPILCSGRDLIGVARTGSGKTLAFLLPCFAILLKEGLRSRMGTGTGPGDDSSLPVQMQKQAAGPGAYSPEVLVIAPSRELAAQIETEARRFTAATGIVTLACYGGEGTRRETLGRLRERPECVVGTVGRLIDFIDNEKHWFGVKNVRFLILDEADAMIGEGLDANIRKITIDVETPRRQTMLFSATFADDATALRGSLLVLLSLIGCAAGMRDDKITSALALDRGPMHSTGTREELTRHGDLYNYINLKVMTGDQLARVQGEHEGAQELTLPAHVLAAMHVSSSAKTFLYSYTHKAFLYLDLQKQVVSGLQVAGMAEDLVIQLPFGSEETISDSERLDFALQPVTVPSLKEKGVSEFKYVTAAALGKRGGGGFVYKFADGHFAFKQVKPSADQSGGSLYKYINLRVLKDSEVAALEANKFTGAHEEPQALTLPAAALNKMHVSTRTKFFFYSYQHKAFLYLDESKAVVSALGVIGMDSSLMIQLAFAHHVHVDSVAASVTLHEVTVPSLKALGAETFAYVKAAEVGKSGSGGFLYHFGDRHYDFKQVSDLATWISRHAVEVRVGMKDPLKANKDVKQEVIIAKDEHDKEGALKSLLRKLYSNQHKNPGKVLIFAFDHDECDSLAKKIKAALQGCHVEVLHGNKKQAERELAMKRFRNGDSWLMVATSIAGRGLDIKETSTWSSTTTRLRRRPGLRAPHRAHGAGGAQGHRHHAAPQSRGGR
ncbi:unnamed protein product, partial [Effrenium voratum]